MSSTDTKSCGVSQFSCDSRSKTKSTPALIAPEGMWAAPQNWARWAGYLHNYELPREVETGFTYICNKKGNSTGTAGYLALAPVKTRAIDFP